MFRSTFLFLLSKTLSIFLRLFVVFLPEGLLGPLGERVVLAAVIQY